MKKRILFVLPSFEIGGTTVSVKNLILLLDKSKYDITVLAMADSGSLQYLYNDVNQEPTSFLLSSLAVASWRDQKTMVGKILCGFIRCLSHIEKVKLMMLKLAAKRSVKKQLYDIVVACQEGICTQFVAQINGRNKIAWVRCDYSRYKEETGSEEIDFYEIYKSIVCVSEVTRQKFCNVFPLFASKCLALNNPQSEAFIKMQAEVDDKDGRFANDMFTIVSIGRYSPIKRFDRIPHIAAELVSKGLLFRWYIVGGGSTEEATIIEDAIKKEGVADVVIPLGIKTNPHFYIKKAHLLVSLSRSEACPRVINEAKILGTPVVCTNFDTAYEYITNDKDGFICPIEHVGEQIANLIQNRQLYQRIVEESQRFTFSNEILMQNIDKLFDI